ncbi:MAG: site-specific recombinase [Desulfuromonadales bacterium]|jgi:site-specific DNA recombinase|nr:site-specific recombinase [Desulfuromonadales bacterium]
MKKSIRRTSQGELLETDLRGSQARSRSSVVIRCAIYTRKSTDEGLDQEFNSLDAQRESAEAFIASQRHEGWICLPDRYDDGGFTGGNMERPALQRLLVDIEAGKIDCVVVYKVDRFSRSLLDFSRMIDLFEKYAISFVSVTQQFNTSHSMGRLTLNILLSFAQFEREIISERTRDKMSAARRKGKWVGGMPVLGYDIAPEGGKLIVNDDEAAQVRTIYQLYLEYKAMMPVVQEIERRGWRTKQWRTRKGRERGGDIITKNGLFRLLSNVLYAGKVDHKGTIYDGEHPAIVETVLWQEVQDTLRRNGRNGGKDVRNKYGALLKGLLYCAPCGTAMIHTYTAKSSGKRYRYYVCLSAQQRGWASCPTKSLNAHEIESAVVEQIRGLGKNSEIVAATLEQAQRESVARLSELETEQRIHLRKLAQLNSRVKKLVDASTAEISENAATDQLADLQEHIRVMEQRMVVVRQDIINLQREAIDENDLTHALMLFKPVWEMLPPRDQSRIIKLLIERIGYDGRDGKVTITFRSLGLRMLCNDQEKTLNERLLA